MSGAGKSFDNGIKLLFIVAILSAVVVFILYFSSHQSESYSSLYFSANDVNDNSITDEINFSFVIENHSPESKSFSFEVAVDTNVIKTGEIVVPANQHAENKIFLPFNKNSFNQKKIYVRLLDTNQEIFFNAGLKVHTTFANGMALVSGSAVPDVLGRDKNVKINLSWVVINKVKENYWIFVHFVDDEGNIIFQYDHQPVVGKDTIKTSELPVDNQLNEELIKALPLGVPDGNYRMLVGLYLPGAPPVKTKLNENYAFIQNIAVRGN